MRHRHRARPREEPHPRRRGPGRAHAPVTAYRTLGLQTTTISTVAGRAPVTKISNTYLAETRGTLISVSANGAPGGQPADPTQVAARFGHAVDKVNTPR